MNTSNSKTDKSNRLATWFSKALRWGLGMLFIVAGTIAYDKSSWPIIAFGALIFLTGFLKPKRCMHNCTIDRS